MATCRYLSQLLSVSAQPSVLGGNVAKDLTKQRLMLSWMPVINNFAESSSDMTNCWLTLIIVGAFMWSQYSRKPPEATH